MDEFRMKRVGVVGVGYVGVHLVEVFSVSFQVTGFDISEERVASLRETMGKDNIEFSTDPESLKDCDMICIAVPTLLKKDNTIDDRHLKSAVSVVQKMAKAGCTVVMESSVHVGMTRKLLGHLLQGGALYIGFSPERVDPGRKEPPCKDIPKIVSGINSESLEKIKYFYGAVFTRIVPVSSMETAEMCKLYENCFRMVNIAYTNEAADACLKLGIDPHEMISACTTKPFGFTAFNPGLGVGGHCIPVNPYYLAVNCDLPLLRFATHTTCDRPARKAAEIVALHPCANTFMVVGLAFKKGESLTTNSPGLAFSMSLKNNHDKRVYGLDPFVSDSGIDSITYDEAIKKIRSREIDAVCIAMKQNDIEHDMLKKTCNDCNTIYTSYVF